MREGACVQFKHVGCHAAAQNKTKCGWISQFNLTLLHVITPQYVGVCHTDDVKIFALELCSYAYTWANWQIEYLSCESTA